MLSIPVDASFSTSNEGGFTLGTELPITNSGCLEEQMLIMTNDSHNLDINLECI